LLLLLVLALPQATNAQLLSSAALDSVRTYRSLEGRSATILGWLDWEAVAPLLERSQAAAEAA
jgi:hypothetical protein